MTISTTAEDPAAIEREIRRTQDDMSSTVEKIGDQLSIKNVFNSLLDKADDSNVDVRMLLDGARRNPVALGLIAAGAIWLISDKDAKFPSIGSKSSVKSDSAPASLDDGYDDYIAHMSTFEQDADEDMVGYESRRDAARAKYFKVERNHDEDESGFRQRLDSMSTTFRQKRHDLAAGTGQLGNIAKEKAQDAVSGAQNIYSENPLVGGILAMAVGAAFGSALPTTAREKKALGPMGEKARDAVDQQKEQITGKVLEKKDELLDKADAALKNAPSTNADTQNSQEAPFMMGH